MPRIRLIIQYDGTGYVGWQTQPNGLAVQEVIERELRKLTGEKPTSIPKAAYPPINSPMR